MVALFTRVENVETVTETLSSQLDAVAGDISFVRNEMEKLQSSVDQLQDRSGEAIEVGNRKYNAHVRKVVELQCF